MLYVNPMSGSLFTIKRGNENEQNKKWRAINRCTGRVSANSSRACILHCDYSISFFGCNYDELYGKSLLFPTYKIIGLENYEKVLSNPYFGKTVLTTVIFVLGSTIFPYVLGMIWAIVLNQGFKGAEFLRGVTLVNWIVPGIAIGFLWTWIFNGQYGILNSFLEAIGLIDDGIPWLGQTSTALICVVIARTWQMLPWYMAFLLGGLQSVPLDQIEAARIDGANNWVCFWRIILPSMKQTAILVFMLGLIGNLQHFDLPWTMVQGGPARATTTLSIEVYTTAFKDWNMGKAATVGTIWAIILACFSIIYIRQANEKD